MYVAQTDDERKAKARKYGNEYYAKNRKRLLEKDKIRYQKNRKKKLAYQRQYRRKNQKKVKESQRKYRKSHKDELKKIHAKWRHENKESLKISKKLEYRKHRSRYKRGNQAYYQKNKENLKKSANDYHHSTKDVVRLEVLRHYSKGKPKCKCCGEKGLPFLTVDHIFGRKKSGDEKRTGRHLITSIRKKGFPPGYQILCWNCNLTKGNYGQCCHKVPWNYNKNKRILY